MIVQPPLRELDHKRALRIGGARPGRRGCTSKQAVAHAQVGIDSSVTITTIMPEQSNHNAIAIGSAFLRYWDAKPPDPSRIAAIRDALLDSLAMARATFEAEAPKGWEASGELKDCSDLPFKIGRSFWTDPVPDVPGMPHFFD